MLQKQCSATDGCNFYTYVMNDNFPICNFFEDCPSVNITACIRCVSSQPGCNVGMNSFQCENISRLERTQTYFPQRNSWW